MCFGFSIINEVFFLFVFFLKLIETNYFLSLNSSFKCLVLLRSLEKNKTKKKKKIDSTSYYVLLLDYDAVVSGEKRNSLILCNHITLWDTVEIVLRTHSRQGRGKNTPN